MLKNKKLAFFLLAANSVLAFNSTSQNTLKQQNEKMYNNMIGKLENGKSNDNNYKLIEKLLKERNKELKDLYAQSDYIVKPEFLEWQMFALGFYSEKDNGDNSSGNSKYPTKTEGYYTASGEFVTTNGKPYLPKQEPKDINLGISIPVKNVELPKITLDLGNVSSPNNFEVSSNIEVPTIPVIVDLDIPSFTPAAPNITTPSRFDAPLLDKVASGFGQGTSMGINAEDTVAVGNASLYGKNALTTITNYNSEWNSSGPFDWAGSREWESANGTYLGGTSNTGKYKYTFLNALADSFYVQGNWEFINGTTGTTTPPNGNSIGAARFISVNHAFTSKGKTIVLNLDGDLNIKGREDGKEITVGIEHQAYDALHAEAKNNKTMTLESGKYLIGFNLIVEQKYQNPYYYDHTGNAALDNSNPVGKNRTPELLSIKSTAENNGKIIIKSEDSIGIDFGQFSNPGNEPMAIAVYSGDIEIAGKHNYGIRVPNVFATTNNDYYNETLINGVTKDTVTSLGTTILSHQGVITVSGEENVGISLSKKITGSTEVADYQGLAVSDNSDLIGNIRNLNIKVDGKKTVGILRNSDYNNTMNGDITLKSIHISGNNNEGLTFGANAKNSVLIRSDRYGIVLGRDLTVDISGNGDNTVMLANNIDSNNIKSKVINDAGNTLTFGSNTNKLTGLMSAYGATLENKGTININGTNSQGLVITDTQSAGGVVSSGINSGSIVITGIGSTGIYNAGEFSMTGGIVTAAGVNSIGIFGADGNNKTNLNGGLISASNSGIAIYSGDNATININGTSLEAVDKGLLLYTYKKDAPVSSGHINLTGTVNATIGAGGTAFYLKGDQSQITPFINSVFSGNGKLSLNMADRDSTLFILDSPAGDILLSSSSSSQIESLIPTDKVEITGSGYKPYSVFKGKLVVDKNVNLDDINDAYNRLDFLSSKTTINSGVILSGNDGNKSVVGQRNYSPSSGTADRDEIIVINNGTISQNGQKVIGIVTDFGHIVNNGIIRTLGDESLGIYGANGTLVKNSGEIEIGDNGIGIYGGNLLTSTAPGYGTEEIEIENDGSIKLLGSTKGVGIYSNNINFLGASILLGVNSNIDTSLSTGGVGIYAKNTTLSGSGSVSVGKNGIGVHLENSNATFNNITMNLNGENAVGFNLSGTTTLGGTGAFNVSGKNTVLFNLTSAIPTNSYINYTGFTVASTGNYIAANMENSGFYINGSDVLHDKSALAVGKKSVILFDNGTNITTDGSGNIVGMADGVYSGTMPFTYTGLGITAAKELTNKGIISIGNDSVALYVKNNASLLNVGNISVGRNSVGVYGNIVDDVYNSGNIEIGENSKGIYLKDSTLTGTLNNGKITSGATSAVGIFSEYNAGGSTLLKTSNEIKLTGANSIGIYTTGSGVQNIENTGLIEIGNSNNISTPSIGIYNNSGNSTENTGIIKVGEKSLAVYNNQGSIVNKGTLDIGSSGVGIYTETGNVTLTNNSILNLGGASSVGVYGVNNAVIQNNTSNISIGEKSYGFVLESGSELTNTALQTLYNNSVFVYGSGAGTIKNSGAITALGANNIMFYTVEGGVIKNSGAITATGKSNIAIYNSGGSIENSGAIILGDSELVRLPGSGLIDPTESEYSVGIYGENSNVNNSGAITIGAGAVGIYVKDNTVTAMNTGDITAGSPGNYKNNAVGIFSEGGKGIENNGNITLYGNEVIGIAGKGSERVTNYKTIKVEGTNAKGIYATLDTEVYNEGIIDISGEGAVGIVAPKGKIYNVGKINISNGAVMTVIDNEYEIPELINAGTIIVDGNFSNEGMKISVKPNLETLEKFPDGSFQMEAGSISADKLTITDVVKILPDFSQGTNSNSYKLQNIFMSNNIITPNGKLSLVSDSLTWEATPRKNGNGYDVYMNKIDYKKFSDGLWFEEFASALDNEYGGAKGNAGTIYDKLDLIKNESDFRHVMGSMAGNIYSNMNQRENDIAETFENSLNTMENSENNTKENIKVSIIAGKGRTKEDTEGIVNYDYTTTGVLALREVERTYKHTVGYSLGYLHTDFEFKDGNESEENANTVQIGLHNKYSVNDWQLKNNITGRVSFYDVDRNIDWPSPTGRSKMSGTYETYSITSDNILGRELSVGKNTSLIPYGALKATYINRPSFSEDGLEALEIEENDAWSVKPRAGIKLNSEVMLGANSAWKLKGSLDVAYEYELGKIDKREHAKMIAIEKDYHKLSKPEEEKGTFVARTELGMEVKDRYGIFLTGEYGVGNNDRENYRAGLMLKAVF